MNIALRQPRMTREEFFDWVQARDARYEFDGFRPVAMTGASVNHNRTVRNIHRALYGRLRGSGCEPMGPDDGVGTIGDAVLYPDALITCAKTPGNTYLVSEVAVVFEVLSPGNGWIDRIVKLREYLAVSSIHTYVIVEQNSIGFTVLRRQANNTWMAATLAGGEVLRLHAPEIEIPLDEFYEGVDFLESHKQGTSRDERTKA